MAKYAGENAFTYLITLVKQALSGKVSAVEGKWLSTNDYTAAEKSKLAGIAASANNYTLPAASSAVLGGVKVGSGLSISNGVLSAEEAGAVAWSNITDKPNAFTPSAHTHEVSGVTGLANVATSGSYAYLSNKPTIPVNNNQLTNGAGYQTAAQVSTAIASAVSSAYKASGSIAFASLPTPAAGNLGNVYNVTDAFTTTSSFVEGSGNAYPANTNVVVVQIGESYKLDVLAGFVDLSGYMATGDMVELTNAEVAALWNAQ